MQHRSILVNNTKIQLTDNNIQKIKLLEALNIKLDNKLLTELTSKLVIML